MTVNLLIVVEDGMIQEISSDNPSAFGNIVVTTIDYDTNGDDRYLVPQEDGSMRGAGCEEWLVEQLTLDLGMIRENQENEYWRS